MDSEQPNRLATLLDEYYAVDIEAGRRLEEAILAELAPLIRGKIRAGGFLASDAEEMEQDAQIRIVNALRHYRAGQKPITNIVGLAGTIVCYIVKEEVRRAAPEYCMKRDVRHLVMYSPLKSLLARWQIEAEWLIGLTKWKGELFRKTPEYAAFCHDDTAFVQQGLEGRDPANTRQVRSPELLLKFLQWVQTPLEELKLVAHLLSLRAKTPRITLSLATFGGSKEPEPEAPQEPDILLNWERCWQEVCSAPLMSRAAFLLALEPKILVVLTSAADPRACVADALDIDPNEMATLWKILPLQNEEIAHRYETTANNIHQRRFRLLQRLKGLEEPPPL